MCDSEQEMLDKVNKAFSDAVDKAILEELFNPSPPKQKREPMEIEVTRTITAKISRCYHECPYFTLDGGPSPTMVCGHPSLTGWEGFGIISHPDCDDGFPEKCPLLKK